MPELLLYLLKVNVALVLFYLAYHVALRRLTFYHLNRLFLVFGIVFSTVYPFIDLSELFANHEPIATAYIVKVPAWAITPQTIVDTPTFDYWQLPVYLFWAGAIVMLIRFIVQLGSLYKIHAASEPANYKSIGFRQVKTISQAFSFWQTIYINPEQHKQDELEQILHHELIHITGWHTLDVLLAELSTVFYWFNPGAWLMKKAVKENLEFIADQQVVNTGVDKKEYQYLLLKVVGATQPQIANQFNFPSLKRRIAMMNKIPSARAHLLKFLAAVPVAAVLLFAANSIAKPTGEIAGYTEVGPDIYIRKTLTYSSVCWNAPNTLTVTPIVGEAEIYDLNNEQQLAEADRKYGLYLPDHDKYNELSATTIVDTGIEQVKQTADVVLPAELVKHLKKNRAVKSVRGKKIDGRDAVVISLKGGGTEVYYLGDGASIAELERKYGLPELPPPPPPAPAAPDALPVPPAPAPTAENEVIAEVIMPVEKYYFIDGVKSTKEAARELALNREAVHSMSIIRGEAAQQLLDDKTATGAVSIITKQNKDSKQVQDFLKRLPDQTAPAKTIVNESGTSAMGGAIYYIDGVEDKSGNYKKLDPKQVYSVHVIKGESAKELFGEKGANGVISIVTKAKKDSKQVQEFLKKLPAAPAPPAPVKVGEQLPPPPPPVRHSKPLATEGAKLVEDQETVTYILWPNDIRENREFDVAMEAFEKSGFKLSFNNEYKSGDLDRVTITLASKKLNKGTSNSYSLAELQKYNNVVVVRGNKLTGEVMIVTTIPASK